MPGLTGHWSLVSVDIRCGPKHDPHGTSVQLLLGVQYTSNNNNEIQSQSESRQDRWGGEERGKESEGEK